MVKKNSEERRKYIRARRILSVRHRLVKRLGKPVHDEMWHMSLTENMSAGGILFTTSSVYQVQDILELDIVMSGILDIFRGYGRVVRVEKRPRGTFYHVAVEYTELKSPRRRAKTFLSKRKLKLSNSKLTV